jgi:hypothetical protein
MTQQAEAKSIASRKRRWLWLVGALSLVIVFWQVDLENRTKPTPKFPMAASIGLYPELYAELWPYYYYGVFPVCTTGRWPLSKPQADRFIANHGDKLVMDLNLPCSMVRHGDFGRLWLLMPAVWLTGNPIYPSVVRLNFTLYVLALLAILWAFWLQDRLLLGCILVLLIGSDPFQREQVVQENIFSLPITFALFALALNLGAITGKIRPVTALIVALISGIVLATARDMRAEMAMSITALPLIYLTIPKTAWRRRLALVAVVAAGFVLTSTAWTVFWNYKVAQAQKWVSDRGGYPYVWYRTDHHTLWHVLWEGLGDYDTQFGYAWDDRKAFAYAAPILRSEYGLKITYTKWFFSDQIYPDRYYWVSLEDLPEYTIIIRRKVLHDITHHPIWYAEILAKRVKAILCNSIPVTISICDTSIAYPFRTYLIPLAWPLLLWRRKWPELKIILISLTLSLTPFLIYSGEGTTYWGIFHLVTIAILVDWAIRAAAYYNPLHVRRTAN